MNYEIEVAKGLLAVKAVSLSPKDPYTWASGLRSPIYCDNRITLAYPEIRSLITQGLVNLIKIHYPMCTCIAGTATAGIAQAALVAQVMDLPMVYVRAKAKDHGKGNQIEGFLRGDENVVVIEDLISTGGSCIEACIALRETGASLLGVAANFSYQLEKASVNFAAQNIQFQTITNYSALIDIALQEAVIRQDDVAMLQEWRKDPEHWYK